MTRVKRSVTVRRRHKKMLKLTKGYRGGRKNLFTMAKNAAAKAGVHAYEDRRLKRRNFRSLWIMRINAALRAQGFMYSRFIKAMAEKKIIVDRKMLAELAVKEPAVFNKIVEAAMAK
ncbi:MAG: 50S ribosomal protein L20 [uncultured bacterium]|nr:MAG: 50S ribosomal protein L20 [uncultured bacterium]OGJ48193.1 MAG: 50S ribosomal protein L20 [Candidatus Peregrinibacteria bacterium RIFOXYB12_FULL_41_12]OGJ48305.1 MAG: 50S ribosomal protein L20 [Candidatus Peregrinibacteria bacterium RIFOXYA2_FULL_41_18]OGJ53457.1 MAG: 50S ribosomal protein L20 [Candidatus Peregrinibacteria bacterium RIFOXYC2_FULL_41_22]OGJ54306.1 MAG: 50S ribosomal protein L20 [Candidatus Peregrinibacteria bacterium RIFOXYB2_FULL_41_88]